MDDFAFIAFDQDSGNPLAHGRTAAVAALAADQCAQQAVLYVLDAFSAGSRIWAKQIKLDDAQACVDSTRLNDAG